MFYVYLLQSISDPTKKYIGFTDDPKQRLQKHNEGGSVYTKPYRPWKIVAIIGVETKEQALNLEKYLKTGSGSILAKRHLWPQPSP